MKNKLKKTFATVLAALTMTTAMASTASADSGTWSMWRSTGQVCHSQDKILTASGDRTYLNISCPTYSTTYYNGQPAHVRYWSYAAIIKSWDDSEVTNYIIPGGFSNRYFYKTTPTTPISFTTTLKYGDYLYLKLRLEDYQNNTCNMSGSYSL